MVRTQTSICEFGKIAPDFSLKGVDNKIWTLKECMGNKGLLVMFICNHCPYVQSIRERIVRDTKELKTIGVNSVAIMSNDSENYPEDSFENMQKTAVEYDYPFPYLLDDSQNVAKEYGAVCTPDFFGFNKNFGLQYRGQLDFSRKELIPNARRDLFLAMQQVAETDKGPKEQSPSIGCSIKWK